MELTCFLMVDRSSIFLSLTSALLISIIGGRAASTLTPLTLGSSGGGPATVAEESTDHFEFDCYSDTGFGHLDRGVVVLNCTKKSLDSSAELNAWLNKHSAFSKLLAKPKYDFIIAYDYNNIKTVTPFPSLPRARVLSMSHNRIDDIASGAFTNLCNLNELDLSHNALTGKMLSPSAFQGPFNLDMYEPLPIKILKLNSNQIHSLSRNIFEHLQFLEQLDLNNNPIKIIDHSTMLAFATLTKLKWLDVGYCQLKKIPAGMFKVSPIETLYLNGNKMETVPRELDELEGSLRKLNLNDNLLMGVSPDQFGPLTHLADIEMNGMSRLRRIESAAFSRLTSLEKFDCSYNPVLTDIGSNLFHHPPDQVVLRNNALSMLSRDVTQWEKVRILDVQSNPWNCNCKIGWLISLLAVRTFVDPEFFMDVKCLEPVWLHGYRLDSLAEHFNALCHFVHSPLTEASSASSFDIFQKTDLQVALSVAAAILIVALLVTLAIRSGRTRNPLRGLKFFRTDRIQQIGLQMGSVQSNIKYRKADQNEKSCELVEIKKDYYDSCF